PDSSPAACPRLERRPALHTDEQNVRGLVECRPCHRVTALGHAPGPIDLARLVGPRRQPQMRAYRLGAPEPRRHVDGRTIGQRHDWADAGKRHQPAAHVIVTGEVHRHFCRLVYSTARARLAVSIGLSARINIAWSPASSRTRASKLRLETTPIFRPK